LQLKIEDFSAYAQGRWIAEYNQATGALIREYVWMGWEPVAVIEGGVTSFIRTDHIGRPVFATNTTGVKTWTASYDPFGGVHTTTGTPINARFPGQWFQSESGLHQNWMRDYDPTTGRYLQADPLGLVDGASVYGYALLSPMMYTDPRGESIWDDLCHLFPHLCDRSPGQCVARGKSPLDDVLPPPPIPPETDTCDNGCGPPPPPNCAISMFTELHLHSA
jgi:RHS repeat-associated protein